jgi:ribonuclease Y
MQPQIVLFASISLFVGLIGGAIVHSIYRRMMDEKHKTSAALEAERILNRAKAQAAKAERDAQARARDFETRARRNVENEIKKDRQRIHGTEAQLKDREQKLDRDYRRKEEQLEVKNRELDEQNQKLKITEARIKELEDKTVMQTQELSRKLESVSSMTVEQAREEIISMLEDEVRKEAGGRMNQIEEEVKSESDKKARRILAMTIARYASEVATERTVASIPLSGDEMKGKIIGREGRNIRALEAACGVDLIIDESPEAVVISSFDPVRREVAKKSLERLMDDGRVHPARIEEVVDKVKSEILTSMKDDGEKACFDLGVHGVHPSLINLLGSLKYRQSDTQNVLQHSIEVGHFAGLMAAEIGFDVKLARRAGLLHDIGKAIDHNTEGGHAVIGAEFARKNGEKDAVVHAIRAHHDDEKPETVLAHLVQAANNLSKARPGARRNMMETYIRRLQDLESVANSFDGVARSFAIQSGKEIRVLVDSSRVTDEQSLMLSRDIARKIERELNYPGQIKVTVVRETRLVEHAR